jgi:hypothetical protein
MFFASKVSRLIDRPNDTRAPPPYYLLLAPSSDAGVYLPSVKRSTFHITHTIAIGLSTLELLAVAQQRCAVPRRRTAAHARGGGGGGGGRERSALNSKTSCSFIVYFIGPHQSRASAPASTSRELVTQ